MKKSRLDILWSIPILMLCLWAVWMRPDAQTASAPAVLCEREGMQVLSGAPAGEIQVYYPHDQLLQGGMLLVSSENPLPKDFPAPNVRGVTAVVGGYLSAAQDAVLTRECIQALCDMRSDHGADSLRITCGALSFAQQNALRRDVFNRYAQVYTLEKAAALSRQLVPPGGESEHQLGTALDIALTGELEMGQSDLILQSSEGIWLRDHMWLYGFIRRYGPDTQNREQGHCENLHLRYVGKVHSAIMHCGHWSLEEYLQILRREGALTLCREGMADAYVYCVPYAGSQGANVLLPHAGYSGSLDNAGYALFWCE